MYHDSSLLTAICLYILAATFLYVSIRNQSRTWWVASVGGEFF